MSPEIDSFRSLVSLTMQQYKGVLREASTADNKCIYKLLYIAQLEWLLDKSENVRNVTSGEATSLGGIKASWKDIVATKSAIAARLNVFYENKHISSMDWWDAFVFFLDNCTSPWGDMDSSLDEIERLTRGSRDDWYDDERNDSGGGGGGPGNTR